jgi:hypothetical protein
MPGGRRSLAYSAATKGTVMPLAALLVLVGVALRLLPMPYNAVPVVALSLFAAARLPRRWAWAVPLAFMILSDIVLDWNLATRPILDPSRLTVYATLVALVGLGMIPRRDAGFATRVAFSLGGSVLFYLTTNFAVWASGMVGYPMTLAGLAECYAAAVPFFRTAVVADLVGTGVLFGTDALVRGLISARRPVLETPAD